MICPHDLFRRDDDPEARHRKRKWFMLTKEDGEKFATRDQIVALHTQVNSIEIQLRDMKHTKLQSRVADLEERVFGETRA